jgi:hypothetical protein
MMSFWLPQVHHPVPESSHLARRKGQAADTSMIVSAADKSVSCDGDKGTSWSNKEDERTRGRITIVESKELLCCHCLVRNVKQYEEGTLTKDTPERRLIEFG